MDSLYALINKEVSEVKQIKHYVALCNIYDEYDFQQFIKCNEQLLTIVKKVKSIQGYGYYYLNKSKVSDLQNNDRQAIMEVQKSRQLFYAIKDWSNYLHSSSILGDYLSNEGEYEKCELLMTKLLQSTKNDRQRVDIYYSLCFLYYCRGAYSKALLYSQKLLLNENIIVKKYIVYDLIANIHRRMSNYDKAFEYYKIANTHAKSPKSVYRTLYTKVLILSETNHSKEALKLAIVCMKYCREQHFTRYIKQIQFLISYLYYGIGNYKKADYFMDEVLKYPFADNEYQIDLYAHKANICLALGNIESAKLFTQKTLSLVDSVSFNMKMIGYDTKIKLEEALGNYKQVAFYRKKEYELLQQKYETDLKEKIYQLEVDLDVTEKENSIKALKIEQLKKQMEITNKDNYLFYISILLLIAIISVLFYVKNFKTIKNKNIIIENEKLLVKKSLAEKETLLKEIHHRVKNNLQLVMSLLNIQAQKSNQNIEDFLEVSKSRILSMALIHENLYQSNNLSKVDIKEYIQNLIEVTLNTYNTINPNIHLQLEIDEISLDIQMAIPLGLIMNELVNNAFKHGFPNHKKGVITIKLKERSKYYELIIKDTGVGISPKNSNQKTLGLKLVEELVFQLDGTLNIENDNGMGYIIKFKENNLEKI
ncbi:MAG: sensor histidine kinase [Arcicella sp.]|nr:sensor histidine kinase [Arcicella sp.]